MSRRQSFILVALAIFLLASGSLAAGSGYFGTTSSPSPSLSPLALASASPTLDPSVAPSPSAAVDPLPSSTPAPSASPTPTPIPIPRAGTYATRIVVASLGINLAIVAPKSNEKFPLCGVAEYMHLSDRYQPGQGGVTYLYAHSRPGMFGIFLHDLLVKRTASLIGVTIAVYTNDDMVFTYKISKMILHQTSLNAAYTWPLADGEVLMLQTCETGRVGGPLMIAAAVLVSSKPASHAASHPAAHPYACA